MERLQDWNCSEDGLSFSKTISNTLEWFKNNKLSVLHWSSQSSGLNPTENLQNYFKTAVLKHHQTKLNHWTASAWSHGPKLHLNNIQNCYVPQKVVIYHRTWWFMQILDFMFFFYLVVYLFKWQYATWENAFESH